MSDIISMSAKERQQQKKYLLLQSVNFLSKKKILMVNFIFFKVVKNLADIRLSWIKLISHHFLCEKSLPNILTNLPELFS